MIRTRNALSRQVQEFFHSHLVGLYRWDNVEHARPAPVDRPDDHRERAEQEWFRGKTHDKLEMRFGPFDLTVLGPFEDEAHPCGLIVIQAGRESLKGPLDPSTWDKVSGFIKEHHTEECHGSEARSDWGR